jgi:type IV pilus assembly protein PilY1
LYMRSRIPASGSQESAVTETCTPSASAAREFYTVVDIVTGKPPAKPVFDTDGGGFTGSEEAGVSRWEVGREDRLLIKTGRPGELISISGKSKGNVCTGNDCSTGINSGTSLVEIGWRQLQ